MTTNETTDWVERCAEKIHSVFAKNEHDIAWPPVNGTAAIIRQHATDSDPRIAQIQAALDRCDAKIKSGQETTTTACAIFVFDIQQIMQ